ncbi:MAG: TGS domain-containing protein [Candidatus Aenigmarchaeota archaeon]|nr:TGS domain-containing protein [Candidatus Aenigmarchaeota archaeon]
MPVNAPIEYYKAEEKFTGAKTREEKILYLEEMIRLLPKHKSSENVLARLRKKLSKLKEQKPKKVGSKPKWSIRKEGAGQVCLIGETNSGKSTLLKELTRKDVEIADYKYTTTLPQFGMMKYEDVWIQIIEIPSTFDPQSISVAYNTDLVLILLDVNKGLGKQKKELDDMLDSRSIKCKRLYVTTKKEIDIEKLKSEIWRNLGKIRVYTKTPGKKPEDKPIVFKKGVTVEKVVREVHKDLLEHFRYAKIWGDSVKFGGAQVGLDHVLKDKDVVQIRA